MFVNRSNKQVLSTLKRFFKDTIIYGIAAVLPRAINILLVKLHTSSLESNKYAENTIYFVYAAYFNAILTYGMETAFFRFFTNQKDKGSVISTSFISLLTTTILFLFLTLVNSVPLSKFFGFEDPIYFQILVLVTTFDTLVVIPFAYLRVTNRPIRFATYKILNISIYALINVYFLLYVPNAMEGSNYIPDFIAENFREDQLVIYIFIANLVASFITFIVISPILFRFQFSFDRKLLVKMLSYGIPLMIAGLAFITNENLDKLLMTKYLGKETMGVYAACYKLGVFMTLYIMAFRLGAEPFFFNHAKEKNAKVTYAKILNWFTVMGAIIFLVIVVYIDSFAQLLLGKEEYFEALKIVPIILLANLFLGIYINLAVWYKLTDKTRYGMYLSVFGALITVVFNVVFIPKIGYMASAWATLMAYSAMTLLSYYFGKKYYRIPYKIKNIFIYLFLSTGFAYVSFEFYRGNLYISALLLIVFFGIIAMNEKREIQEILK